MIRNSLKNRARNDRILELVYSIDWNALFVVSQLLRYSETGQMEKAGKTETIVKQLKTLMEKTDD